MLVEASGAMSIQTMKTRHPNVASGDEEKVTPAEKQALYVAYFGRDRVDTARGVVVHQVEGDLADVFIGRDEERPFRLDGDRLLITPSWTVDGVRWTGRRVFERVK